MKIIIFPILIYASPLHAQNFNKEVDPVINIEKLADDIFRITASAKNLTETVFSLQYELSTIKKGQNSSKSSQSNYFSLQPSEIKTLATTTVNLDKDSEIIVLLFFKDDDEKIISTRREVISADSEKMAEEELSYQNENEGIKLSGFVTENTKTKMGKDFYDFFYQKYQLSGLDSQRLISVNEIISFGRTTRLNVMVEDRVVYQFFAEPKLDYLRENADNAINQLSRYLQYLENRNEYQKQY